MHAKTEALKRKLPFCKQVAVFCSHNEVANYKQYFLNAVNTCF